MINFNEILKKNAISKVQIAKRMGIEQSNVNRTLDKFSRNLSEIDNFLQILGTSLAGEMQKNKPQSESILKEPSSGFVNIQEAVFNVITSQSKTILSQQRVIERIYIKSKKGRREGPTLRCQQKTVVSEMVVGVGDANIKSYAAKQLLQVLVNFCTMLDNEIYNVQITIS